MQLFFGSLYRCCDGRRSGLLLRQNLALKNAVATKQKWGKRNGQWNSLLLQDGQWSMVCGMRLLHSRHVHALAWCSLTFGELVVPHWSDYYHYRHRLVPGNITADDIGWDVDVAAPSPDEMPPECLNILPINRHSPKAFNPYHMWFI